MEKEEKKSQHEEGLEAEENEEASSLKVRRSRTPIAQDNTSAATQDTCTTQLDSDHSNSKTNGHIIRPSNSPTENAVDADESVLDREKEEPDDKIAALLTATEVHKETQTVGAHSRSDPCVYYDKDEGMWKCRICCWTFGTPRLSVDLIRNPELMIYKTLNQRELCFTSELEGSKMDSAFSGDENIGLNPGDVKYDADTENFGVLKSFDSVIDSQVEVNKKDKNLSSLQHSMILSEECGATCKSSATNEIVNEDIDLINEIGLEETDIGVERVLEKQNTHDLYCPNCNSCITRRVILRKRKRRVRITGEDVKRNKLETAIDSSLARSSGQATNIQVHNTAEIQLDGTFEPAVNECEREREPDIFRCLSCFSFFIPTGNGFKLFRIFRDKGEKIPVEDQQKASLSKSGTSSIFASDKERTLEPGSGTRSDSLETTGGTCLPASHVNVQDNLSPTNGFKGRIAGSQEDGNKISPSAKELFINGSDMLCAGDNSNNRTKEKDAGDAAKKHYDAVTSNQPITSDISVDVVPYHQSDPFKAPADKFSVISGESPVTGSQPNTSNIAIDVVAYHQNDPFKTSTNKIPVINGESPITSSQPNTSNVSIDVVAYNQSVQFEASADKIPVINGESPKEAVDGNQPDGLKLLISSHGESPTPEKSCTDQNPDLRIQNNDADKESILSLPTGVVALTGSHMSNKTNIVVDISHKDGLHVGAVILNKSADEKGATFRMNRYEGANLTGNSQQTFNESIKEVHAGQLFTVNKDPLVLSMKDISLNQKPPATIAKDPRKVATGLSAGKDTVIVVDSETVDRAASQRVQDLSISEETWASPTLATHTSVTEARGADSRQAYQIEVIKSIVYGGLIESITSLGVVSSAAGGNTATLNILALALANLIGGLILIGHNLWDLKKEQVSEQMDRYKELLGNRENFFLHATVVLLSFLIFGIIPPITYGFSFRKSDDRELKLLAVAVASFVCILLLAIGKEYVQRPPKSYLKTIVYFVGLGFMVSGVSFAVGELIKKFLEKVHFHSSSPVFLTLPGITPAAAAESASY